MFCHAKALSSQRLLKKSMRIFAALIMIFISSALMAQSYNELFIEGEKLLKANDYSKAAQLFKQVIERDSTNKFNEYAYSNLAFAQWQLGEGDSAIESYTKALAYNPESAQIMQQRARLYLEQENVDSALADYNTVLSIEPRNSHALFMRAYLYGEKKEYNKAYADYNALLAIEPANNDARLSLALLYHRAGRLNDALMLLGLLIDGNPQNAEYYYARSNVEREEKLTALAIMDIEKAIELAPKNAQYHIAHAQLLLTQGQKRAARAALDRAVAAGHLRAALSKMYEECSTK